MDIYQKKTRWKTILALVAAVLVLLSLIYTSYLARQLASEERKKVELVAASYKAITQAFADDDLTFYLNIIAENKSIPLITVDENDTIINSLNFNETRSMDSAHLRNQLSRMKQGYPPIVLQLEDGSNHYVYYKDSKMLNQLKLFPVIQIGIIVLFLAVAYYLFNKARQAQQNQLWVGLSKETAHQLGTPVSSLMAWVENLKETKDETVKQYLPEIEKDVSRLELVTDRFSKIGSQPQLTIHSLKTIIKDSTSYIQRRASKRITITTHLPEHEVKAALYPQLFNWVLENIMKNALDAMDKQGKVDVFVIEENRNIRVDIKDTGKGISVRNKNVVFKPGYSTKKRGWGLGLSLSKRIIEDYHKGHLFVKESAMGKGTTFSIVLPKKNMRSS